MSTLAKIYQQQIRPGIVAFIHKYIPVEEPQAATPPFPPIIGTGFVVSENGIVATNAHVVRAFGRVFRPEDAPQDEWPVQALLFHLTDAGMVEIPLDILGVAPVSGFQPGKVYYGPKKGPDLAFVHVKAHGLPMLQIDSETQVEEGMTVCTAGFPMGTDALTAPGWLHQITPTLQSGIVSAVMPFVCKTPHAFSINVMTQGGASGSPVFLAETGGVVGVLYAGLHEFDIALDEKTVFRTPTTVSYVVPAHYVAKSFESIIQNPNIQQPDDSQTISEMLATKQLSNVFEEGRKWIVKQDEGEPKLLGKVRFKDRPDG